MKVLVTGGSGFLGKNLKKFFPNWIYMDSKSFDLKNQNDCMSMLETHSPDVVIHLAARVGGIKDNLENQARFYYDNVAINTNIIHSCYLMGIQRLIASLSTCAFPDVVSEYPFTEKDIHSGPPAKSNFSYGYAKRSMLVQINAYREQYNLNYTTFSPSNLYGPFDDFNSEKSHFVPAMIRKLLNAKENEVINFWGTGKSLRQQLYVEDLVKIIPRLIENHNDNDPILVCPDENLSIEQMIAVCLSVLNKNVNIVFDQTKDGQFRKDGSNKKLKSIFNDFQFTSFRDGIEKTINWYLKNENSNNYWN